MLRRALVLCLSLAALTPSAFAQKDKPVEEFEEVDPYTEGDKELMELYGYKSYGPFLWRPATTTTDLKRICGDAEMLVVETEHFRIASTLTEYKLIADRDEKEKLKEEFKALKDRHRRIKLPKKAIDPWLRLHLYAMRAEKCVADLKRDFGIEPSHYEDIGPYMGQNHKFLILLCQRDSELSRFIKEAWGHDGSVSWRYGWGHKEGMFYGASYEAIVQSWAGNQDPIPYDSILHTRMVQGITSNLLDGYRNGQYGVPRWLLFGASYEYGRRVDPRWVNLVGQTTGNARDDEHVWEPRVRNLVSNDFFITSDKMFTWNTWEGINSRDHIVAWSRLDYLLRAHDEANWPAFLEATCLSTNRDADEDTLKSLNAQALTTHMGLSPSELDERWAKWVKKTYSKK